jgi:hypothetical protein
MHRVERSEKTLKPEEKSTSNGPHINFVWFGAFKESSFKGPISLANAKNDEGQSYPITYWVEEDRVSEAKTALSGYGNIQVKSIHDAIHDYCNGDSQKEKKINSLLEKCRTLGLPTIQKEILAAIIQSLTSGYFFDTSISAEKRTNLPMLTHPALPRNLEPLRGRVVSINDENRECKQYKAKGNNRGLSPISTDLYAYFSSANSLGEVSPHSKELFSKLAEDTIVAWELFFNKNIEYKADDVSFYGSRDYFIFMKLQNMVNDVLLGSVVSLYGPQSMEDEETIILLDKDKNILITYDRSTGMPSSTESKCKFTTIDAVMPEMEGSPSLINKDGLVELQLYCGGNKCGITKYCGATWKELFKDYIIKQISKPKQSLMPEGPKQEEGKPSGP